MIKNKFLLVTAPITNGGDFLIEHAMQVVLKRNEISFDLVRASELERVDSKDYKAIITGGGPKFSDRLFEEDNLKLNDIIQEGKCKIHFMGSGIYGDCYLDNYIYSYYFTPSTLEKLNQIVQMGGSLGCRDIVSYNVLKNNKLSGLFLTGCPVWYLDDNEKEIIRNEGSDLIVVSDPGKTKEKSEHKERANQVIELLKYLKNRFPHKKIIYTFNNGIKTKYSEPCNNVIKQYLEENNIQYYSLEKNYKGFELYNKAFMHIGFRVHSHLYCISKGIPSILIEEDIRGYGMNETLGLRHITSYVAEKAICGIYQANSHMIDHLDNEIDFYLKDPKHYMYETQNIINQIYKDDLKKWITYINR